MNVKKFLVVAVVAAAIVSLTACGSTKVYNEQKTIVFHGSMYNISNVVRISSRIDGTLPNGETVQLGAMDKDTFRSRFGDSLPIQAKGVITLDDTELVYTQGAIAKYKDLEKMQKALQGALKDIRKFMKKTGKAQMELK